MKTMEKIKMKLLSMKSINVIYNIFLAILVTLKNFDPAFRPEAS